MFRSILALLALTVLMVGPAVAAEFNHGEHLTYLDGDEADCSTCHLPGAASIAPAPEVCKECHEEEFVQEVVRPGLKTHGPVWPMNHGAAAKAETIDCNACHQQADCLDCHVAGFANEMGSFGNGMINVHRSEFHVSHPIAARTDPQLCTTCHEKKFCNDCHDQFAPADLAILSHRRGWSNITVGVTGPEHGMFDPSTCSNCHTDSVLPAHEWGNAHAREARKNLATCQACHPEGDVCLKCHSATTGLGVNPHPKDWGDMKNRLDAASNGRTCRKCH